MKLDGKYSPKPWYLSFRKKTDTQKVPWSQSERWILDSELSQGLRFANPELSDFENIFVKCPM